MTTITTQQVKDALIKACTENPDKTNPVAEDDAGYAVCLYNDGNNNRCIAGEVIFMTTGENLPSDLFKAVFALRLHRDDDSERVTQAKFAYEASDLLQQAQNAADRQVGDELVNRTPWGDVLTELRHNNLL